MFFLFDEIGLIIVIIGCFFGGFLPLLILIMICPEARQHIKCRVTGGIIVEKFYDTGQCEYVVAKPTGGEGQYMAGKNAFGQREIYIKPRMPTPFMTKPFLLSGMRRLKYFAYAGKVPIVNHETLMAMSVVEAPTKPLKLPENFVNWAEEKYPDMLKKFKAEANNGGSDLREKILPPEIVAWASENELAINEPELGMVEQPVLSAPDANGLVHVTGTRKVEQQIGSKEVYYPLLNLDPRKLKQYNSDNYDESQIDNLIEAARIEGYHEGHEGKKFNIGMMGKIAIAFIVIAIIGGVVILALQGAGA